jgi:transposase InsO family protein
VYLTVILDLYARKIIGRVFGGDMETVHTGIPALEMAFANPTGRLRRVCYSISG